MKRYYASILVLAIVMASTALAAPLDILSVNDDEIVVEGTEYGGDVGIGDRFAVRDYNGKDIAVIAVKNFEIFPGSAKRNYICKIVNGERNINPGYTLHKYELMVKGSYYFEYSSLSLDQEANASFENLSGMEARIKDKGMLLSLGLFAIGVNKNYKVGAYLSTSYIDLGRIKTWSVVDAGLFFHPSLYKEKIYFGLTVGGGVGPTFGDLYWQRPEGTYDDDLAKNSGRAKIQTINAGMMFNYRLMAMTSINLHRYVGLQFRVGYLGLAYGRFIDKDVPDEVAASDYDRWEIRDDWLETDIGKGSMTIGVGLMINVLTFE